MVFGMTRRLFLAYAAVSLSAILSLPYFVPLARSASTSYVFGYNNKAGVILLLLSLAFGTLWSSEFRFSDGVEVVPSLIRRRTLLLALLFVLAGCAVMYALAGRFGGFGESSYEIDRAWLTSIGQRPYLDFEWPFGLALLYGPLAIRGLLHTSVPQSCYIFWGLNALLGVWLLYAVVNAIDYPSPHKRSIFLLLYSAWFFSIVTMGTHYTLTRYTLPLYFLLSVYRQWSRKDISFLVRGILMALLFAAILFLYSPETAIAFGLVSTCLFPFSAKARNAPFYASFLAYMLGLAVLVGAAFKLHILDTVIASGGGADSFPIILCPHILLFCAALFICACYVRQQVLTGRSNGNSICLIALAVPMLPAALGRCDPGHVLFNGLGIFLASLVFLSGHKRAWKYTMPTFAVIMIGLPLVGGLWSYMPLLAKCGIDLLASAGQTSPINRMVRVAGASYIHHFGPRANEQKRLEHLDALLNGSTSTVRELATIYPGWNRGYLAPFGYKPNGFGSDLTTLVDYGRYEGDENANTPAAIDTKLDEIRDNPRRALLLPDNYDSNCTIDVRAVRHEIEILFMAPYLKGVAHPQSLRAPICAYIQQHYVLQVPPTARTYSYGLWVNRDWANN